MHDLYELDQNASRLVAEHIPAAVTISGPDRRILWVNERFEKMTGYTQAEAIGYKPGELLQGSETDPQTIAHMSRKLARKEGFDVDVLNYKKDGTPFWNNVKVAPVYDERGILTHFIGYKQEISKRIELHNDLVRSRNTLYRALSIAPFPIMIHSSDGSVEFINDAWQELSGFDEDQFSTVTEWISLSCHPTDSDQMESIKQLYYEDSSPQTKAICRIQTNKGDTRFWNIQSTPLDKTGNTDNRFITIAADLTEKIQQHRKLKRSLEENDTLLREVHHRVRNNLSLISSFINLQKEEIQNVNTANQLSIIEARILAISTLYKQYQQYDSDTLVKLSEYLQDLNTQLSSLFSMSENPPNIRVDAEQIQLPVNQAEPIGIFVEEILTAVLTRMQDAGSSPTLSIICSKKQELVQVEVSSKQRQVMHHLQALFNAEQSVSKQIITAVVEQVKGDLQIIDKKDQYSVKTEFSLKTRKGSVSLM